MRIPAFCNYENKGADQLHSNCTADQRLCFRYINSTIPLLPKYEISSHLSSFVTVQPGLCRTWSKPRRQVFSRRGSCITHEKITLSFNLQTGLCIHPHGQNVRYLSGRFLTSWRTANALAMLCKYIGSSVPLLICIMISKQYPI